MLTQTILYASRRRYVNMELETPYARHRERTLVDVRNVPFTRDLFGVTSTCSGPGIPTYNPLYSAGYYDADYWVESMDDLVTPGFEYLKNKGMIVNSPMTKVSMRVTQTAEPYEWYRSYGKSITCNPPPSPVIVTRIDQSTSEAFPTTAARPIGTYPYLPVPDIEVEALKEQAILQSWANADVAEAAALVTLAEAQKTVKGLVDVFYRVTRLIKDFISNKARLVKDLKHTGEDLQSIYLAFRYGLRPLYFEIQQYTAGIFAVLQDAKLRQTYRGFATDVQTASNYDDTKSYTTDVTGTYWQCLPRSYESKREVKCRAGLLCQVNCDNLFQIFGFHTIAESAWEVVPFSFILDWFVNIGQFIAAWTPLVGLKALASWVVVEDTSTQSLILGPSSSDYSVKAGYPYSGQTIYYHYEGQRSSVSITKTRGVEPRRPGLPRVQLRLDGAKLLDLVLILKQHLYHL